MSVGAGWVDNEEGEHSELNSIEDIGLRHEDVLADLETAGLRTGEEDRSHNHKENPGERQSNEFWLHFVLESVVRTTSEEFAGEVSIGLNVDQKRQEVNQSSDQRHRVVCEKTVAEFPQVLPSQKDHRDEDNSVGGENRNQHQHSNDASPLLELSELLVGVGVERGDDGSDSVDVAKTQEDWPEDG